jgi:acetylornithine deacetylase/succinyl-diaminopimelate desuccinylase-like protein
MRMMIVHLPSPRRRTRHARLTPGAALLLLACLPAIAAGSDPAGHAADDPAAAARSHCAAHGGAILREFAELLRIPNTATDPAGLARNAAWIRDALARRGVAAQLLESPDAPPLVHGTLRITGATRTLGIYLHYDGQPVAPADWTQPPFEPTLRDGDLAAGGVRIPWPGDDEPWRPDWRLYARSSSDDKAPVAAILAALDAVRAAGIPLRSNLVFLMEGEEESGSDHLGDALARHAGLLEADVWLICDGPVHQSRRPQLVFGVRGYAGLEITVLGANRHLHSGHYGNWAPNPALELARLLASMKDADGEVLIEGFHAFTRPIEPAVREAAATIPPFEDALREELGLARTEGGGASYLDRMLVPSLNVRGLQGGAVGEAARNVIPSSATASLDLRLAAGNEPERMLDLVEDHVRRQGFHVVHAPPSPEERLAHARIAVVERRGGYPAVRTPVDLPVSRWVQDAARRAAGDRLILMPTLGGSLPLYLFEARLATPLVIVPIVNHDNNQHGPDENLRLGNLTEGAALMAALMATD